MSAVYFPTFWWRGNILQTERKQISPFHLPPLPNKLYNNHPVSGLPPGLRFQFCTSVPRRSHELTLKFCSGRRGSGSAAAPLWQLASQTISERLSDCTAALESITASHLRLFPRGAALHERWSTGSAVGLLQRLHSITFTSCFLRHHRRVTGGSFVLVNLSLRGERRQLRRARGGRKMCSAVSFIWGKDWNCIKL